VDIVHFVVVVVVVVVVVASPPAAGEGGAARLVGYSEGYIPIVRRVWVFSSMVLEAKLAVVGSSVLSRSYSARKQTSVS